MTAPLSKTPPTKLATVLAPIPPASSPTAVISPESAAPVKVSATAVAVAAAPFAIAVALVATA